MWSQPGTAWLPVKTVYLGQPESRLCFTKVAKYFYPLLIWGKLGVNTSTPSNIRLLPRKHRRRKATLHFLSLGVIGHLRLKTLKADCGTHMSMSPYYSHSAYRHRNTHMHIHIHVPDRPFHHAVTCFIERGSSSTQLSIVHLTYEEL